MEILDNSNPIKDNEDQTSGGNYTCRLPRDLNIGNGSVARSKGETDVRLLVACKAQLSSEVIKWKTESLRLQKERDAARVRLKELDQVVGKYTEKTKELEYRLSAAENENKKLKEKVLVPSSINALQKLSLSSDKHHSYPWLNNQTNPLISPNSCLNTVEKKNSLPQEDWKEVSQKLLEKMKQEMKELQELSYNFSLQENDSIQLNAFEQDIPDANACDDKFEESLSSLISETVSIKQCLLEQRKNLKALLNDAKQGNIHIHEKGNKYTQKVFRTFPSVTDHSVLSVKPKPSMSHSSRHSDDSFREFFTKQLESCQNIDKMNKTMQLFIQSSDSPNMSDSNKTPAKNTSSKVVKPLTDSSKKTEDERVCPICQAPFNDSIPQNEFEEHVLDHLEVESASLLDQYVVL